MYYDILKFGASEQNSPKENGIAIQAAVDAAFQRGGGTVYVPPGCYVTANIQIKSNVFFYLEHGATLLGSTNFEDYELTDVEWPWEEMVGIPSASEKSRTTGLLYAVDATNIGVGGYGALDGNGMDHLYFPSDQDPYRRRPMLIFFDRCKNVHIENITMRNSAMFASWMSRSRGITIQGVKIFSMRTENGDGLDFNGCSDVMISNCVIESGDDAISLKTLYPEWPCVNYTISNCIIRSIWAGFRMGTESTGDMRDITLTNCVFEQCNDGLKIQDCSIGVYENVRISNITMRDVHRPIFITTSSFQLSRYDPSIRPALGGIRDIFIDGLTAYMHPESHDYQRNCLILSGSEKSILQNICITNSKIVFRGAASPDAQDRVDTPEFLDYSFMYGDVFSINGDYPASGLFLRHIDGLSIKNCQFICDDHDTRPMLFGYDLCHVDLHSVSAVGVPVFFQAVDASVSMSSCLLNDVPVLQTQALDGQSLVRYHEFIQMSRDVDRYLAHQAATVDKARACAHCKKLDDLIWQKSGRIWSTTLSLPARNAMLQLVTYGDVEVLADGQSIGSCRLPKLYRGMMVWAIDLSAVSSSGSVLLELHWDDPDDHGGADCLLPFGTFRPYSVGLCAPLRLYYDKT